MIIAFINERFKHGDYNMIVINLSSQQMEKFERFQDEVQSTLDVISHTRDAFQKKETAQNKEDKVDEKMQKDAIDAFDPTSSDIQIASRAPQRLSKMARLMDHKKTIEAVLKAYYSAYQTELYLLAILLTSLFSYSSCRFYREALICKRATEQECIKKLMPIINEILKLAILVFMDCFFLIFYIYVLVTKKTYRAVTGLAIVLQVSLYYVGGFQMSLFSMMGFITIAHYVVLFISILILIVTFLLIFGFKKNAKITLFGLIMLSLALYFIVWHDQCRTWSLTINGSIEPKEGSCEIAQPKCAILQAISHFDLNFFLQNCFLGEKYKQVFNRYFSQGLENGTFVGFSDLKGISQVDRSHGNLATTVYNSARRYKTIEQAQQTRKHDVIFDTLQQRYHIDIIYNKSLAEQKAAAYRKFQSSSSPPLAKNVLLIFLDSVSRFQTHLKLPKFVSWFGKQARYKSYSLDEPKGPSMSEAKSQAYEFTKYHALGYFTSHNVYAIFYGKTMEQLDNVQKLNGTIIHLDSLHKDFSQRGFVTSYSSSACAPYGADMYEDYTRYISNPIADHQCFSFNCDPNFHEPSVQLGFVKGNSASTDRCLYHKTEAEYAFEYTSKFFDEYRNSSKFSQINLIEGHDFVGGSVRYLDNAITSFLEQLQKKGHLKDTLVLALSDHGQHLGQFDLVITDHFNPFMLLAVPEQMNQQYRDSIRLNQQTLVTAYNVYHFLMHVAIGEEYRNKGLGLMGDLSFQTNCSSANMYMPNYQKDICYCH